MWIAQHPCGTWCSYKDEPRKKAGGWDGCVYAKLNISLWILSWRGTLKWVPDSEYIERYMAKEVW